MQSKANDCRARAQDCESAAWRAATPKLREHLLDLAHGWRDVADHLERRARITTLADPAHLRPSPSRAPRP